ncbi:MAG: hypothetical protein OHK0028_20160 [Deltaproteobacteria bacterium]
MREGTAVWQRLQVLSTVAEVPYVLLKVLRYPDTACAVPANAMVPARSAAAPSALAVLSIRFFFSRMCPLAPLVI